MKYFAMLLIGFSIQAQQRFSQTDFDNSRTLPDTFHLWYYPYMPVLEPDKSAFLVDDSEYKGHLNYGLSFEHEDGRFVSHDETFSMHGIRVSISGFSFNPKDSTATITGMVSGGWTDPRVPWKGNATHIFVGALRDSVTTMVFKPKLWEDGGYIISYKQKVTSDDVTLDQFPSKLIVSRSHFQTAEGNNRAFSVKTKIAKDDVLIFGQFSTFAEVFEIGKMIYGPKSRNRRNFDRRVPTPKHIVIRNVQVKYDTVPKPAKSRYYVLTDKAEAAILKKQFAKAAICYDSLHAEFPYIFARDLHNAARANALSRRVPMAIRWCEKLARKGMKPEYFSARVFDKVRKSPEWNGFLTRYPEFFAESEKASDTLYSKELNAITDFDQAEYTRNSKGESSPEKLAAVTLEANRRFIALVERAGFPIEEKIGVAMLNDTIVNSSQGYQVVLYHSQQMRTGLREKMASLRSEAAVSGDYDAVRDQLENLIGNPCYQVYRGKLYRSKSCISADIGQEQKIAYRFSNPNGFVIDSGYYATIAHDPDDPSASDKAVEEEFEYIKTLTTDELWYLK